MANAIDIATTIYDEMKNVVHVPASAGDLPALGAPVTLALDWHTRYRNMRAHTMMHLLCACVPFPVTGGSISEDGGRIDFDIPEGQIPDKEELAARINQLILEDHAVTFRWISDAEMEANLHLIRTMSVKPPMGTGKVRLVMIGDEGKVDLQPCGGTHVRSTAEIGPIARRQNRKQGQDQPPHPPGLRISRTLHVAGTRFNTPGSPSIWPRPISPSSMLMAPARRQARCQGGVPRSPHSRRAVLRHRCDFRHRQPPAPHAARAGKICQPRAQDGHRRRQEGDLPTTASGLFSAARAWWMFRVFGHDDVAVLDGGLPKWKAENRPLEDGPPIKPQERHFTARFQSMMVRDKSEVLRKRPLQVADARSPGRFRGEEAGTAPRRARRTHAGRQECSLCHTAESRRHPETGKRNWPRFLKRAGIDIAKPVITSCGSGVTAAILSLGLTTLGRQGPRAL